ncbi:uncharacterized protein G2W53_002545 [Senna tora]|uniref:Hydroxyproline-rich glycoprotein family protein n=1 Tax=Senna tora TaxID=362788 RepID=A0A834X9L9_9FABA|nr:uncharacterized protein G2W53_002545 [Senna tora]
MTNVGFCGLKPLLFRRKPLQAMKGSTTSKNKKSSSKAVKEGSSRNQSIECSSIIGADQLILMMDVHHKILAFRDIMDLPPCTNHTPLREMIIKTLEDLQRLYPGIIRKNEVSENKGKSIDKVMAYFIVGLKSVGESWMMNNEWMNKVNYQLPTCTDRGSTTMKELGEMVSATLDCLIKLASEKFDTMAMEEDEQKKLEMSPQCSSSNGKFTTGSSSSSFSDTNLSCSSSPVTPKSVLPDMIKYCNSNSRAGSPSRNNPCTSPLLWSLRLQAVGKLNPIDVKRLSFHMSPPRMESHYDYHHYKIEEDHMETDDKSHDEEDLVFHLDTSTSHAPPPPSVSQTNKVQVVLPPPSVSQSNQVQVVVPPPPPPPSASQSNQVQVVVPPPPPPPSVSQSNQVQAPPPPTPATRHQRSNSAPPPPGAAKGNGVGPPPPPPLGAGKSLRPKSTTKLKRSTHLGSLYRNLKGKVEGNSLNGKSSGGRKGGVGGGGGSSGGKQGMADALAEMTKRSSYFLQIEEDVQKYTNQITVLSRSITTFKSNEMTDLVKFHREVESVLENLTDESQVLSRFEGFPTKKLEAIRTAAALFNKLNSILTELQNWNVVPPLAQLLDKVERYFNKIKTDLDALERTKDEESKKFKSHNIEFDFHMLIRIKEAMVDVSSNCMELALKERREAGTTKDSTSSASSSKVCTKMLWKAFQFAFRVYTFAGGHDERADRLTRELAQEIENDPPCHQ